MEQEAKVYENRIYQKNAKDIKLTDDEEKELEHHTNYCSMPSGEW